MILQNMQSEAAVWEPGLEKTGFFRNKVFRF